MTLTSPSADINVSLCKDARVCHATGLKRDFLASGCHVNPNHASAVSVQKSELVFVVLRHATKASRKKFSLANIAFAPGSSFLS